MKKNLKKKNDTFANPEHYNVSRKIRKHFPY